MKKIFALALAAVMTAGMTTVAFADRSTPWELEMTGSDVVMFYDEDGEDGINTGKNAPDLTTNAAVNGMDSVDGGTEFYIRLKNSKTNEYAKTEDDLSGWRISTDWTLGKSEKPKFESVKIDGSYYYALKVTLPEAEDDKATDLAGKIIVYSSVFDDDYKATNRTLDLSVTYGYAAQAFNAADKNGFENAEIVSFKGCEEETLDFGDYFTFEVDVTGQSKLNLKNNQDFDKEFAAMYEYANIDFITFEKKPTFNKNGVAYIYADEDAFIYEVTADGAKEITGLKWDEDYEAWTFKTRTLTSYAISDVELDEKTVTEDKTDDESSKTDDGVKENPDTGR